MNSKMDEQCRVWQRIIRQKCVTVAVKTLCLALPLLLVALAFAAMWLTEEPPSQWCTETVHYRQVRRESAGRGASMDWFVAMDGRKFATTRKVVDAVDEALSPGALCEVTYRQRLWTRSICGLTSDGVVFVDRAQNEVEWEADRAEMLLVAAITAGLALLSAALCYGLWCRQDRREIADLQARIARRERGKAGA